MDTSRETRAGALSRTPGRKPGAPGPAPPAPLAGGPAVAADEDGTPAPARPAALAAAGGNTEPYEDIGDDIPPPAFAAPAGTPIPPPVVDELAAPEAELAAAGAADAGAVPPAANGAPVSGPAGACGTDCVAAGFAGENPPAAELPAAKPRPNSLPSDDAPEDGEDTPAPPCGPNR